MFHDRRMRGAVILGVAAVLAGGPAPALPPEDPGEERFTARPGPERVTGMGSFEQIDRNRDRFISPGEYREWQRSALGRSNGGGEADLGTMEFVVIGVRPVTAAEREARARQQAEAQSHDRFRELDEDADGEITREQFLEYGEDQFDEADGNADGILTQDEFKDLPPAGG